MNEYNDWNCDIIRTRPAINLPLVLTSTLIIVLCVIMRIEIISFNFFQA